MLVKMVNEKTGACMWRNLSAENVKLLCDVAQLMEECLAFWEDYQDMTAYGYIPSLDDVRQLVSKWKEKQERSSNEDQNCLSA